MPVRRKRRRTADAAYAEEHPTLAARLTPEEAEAVRAAGGAAAVLRAHLAGGCVTRAQAEALATKAADAARLAAEEEAVGEADALLDKVMAWESWGKQARVALGAAQAQVAALTREVDAARAAGYQAGAADAAAAIRAEAGRRRDAFAEQAAAALVAADPAAVDWLAVARVARERGAGGALLAALPAAPRARLHGALLADAGAQAGGGGRGRRA